MPLRLVSLVELDAAGDSGEAINAAHIHANTVLTEASGRLPGRHEVSVDVAHGRTIEEAIDELEWDDGEILIVGSSRLAEKNRLFIGQHRQQGAAGPAGADGGCAAGLRRADSAP